MIKNIYDILEKDDILNIELSVYDGCGESDLNGSQKKVLYGMKLAFSSIQELFEDFSYEDVKNDVDLEIQYEALLKAADIMLNAMANYIMHSVDCNTKS